MQSVSFAEEENIKSESDGKPQAVENLAPQTKLSDAVMKSILYQWNIIRVKHPNSKLNLKVKLTNTNYDKLLGKIKNTNVSRQNNMSKSMERDQHEILSDCL